MGTCPTDAPPPQAHSWHRGPARSPLTPNPRKMASSKQPLLHKLPPATSRRSSHLPFPGPSVRVHPGPPLPHTRTSGKPQEARAQVEVGRTEGLRKASGEGPRRPHFLQGQSLHTSPQASSLLSSASSLTLSEAKKHTHQVTDSRSHVTYRLFGPVHIKHVRINPYHVLNLSIHSQAKTTSGPPGEQHPHSEKGWACRQSHRRPCVAEATSESPWSHGHSGQSPPILRPPV